MATGIEGTTDGGDCVEDVRAFYKKQIAELERQLSDLRAALEGKWISVETRLPKKFEHVMIYLKPVPEGPDWYPRTNYTLGWQKRGIWFGTFINMETGLVEKGDMGDDLVTHWQPLPPAPKEA